MPLISRRRHGEVIFAAILVVFLSGFALTAAAGTVCGNITDADTGQPVDGAGIFARDSAGIYAEALAVSDPQGNWCIENLAEGTYTLEFRVDNYVTAYVTGVVVTGDVSDVPLTLTRKILTFDPPWPNPATGGVKMRVHLAQAAPLKLGIYDLRGRLIRSWSADRIETGSREYFWDGRDATGRPSPAGLYFARVRSGDHKTIRPITLTR